MNALRTAIGESEAEAHSHRAHLSPLHLTRLRRSVDSFASRCGSPSRSYQHGCDARSAVVSGISSSRGDWKNW